MYNRIMRLLILITLLVLSGCAQDEVSRQINDCKDTNQRVYEVADCIKDVIDQVEDDERANKLCETQYRSVLPDSPIADVQVANCKRS